MDTKQLEYIIAIAEEGNMTKAAERMFISQPALSQQLRNLEEELKTPLFERNGRSLKPTKAGLIYLNGARSILNINNSLINDTPSRQSDRVVVCVSGAVPSSTICRALNALQKIVPDAITEVKKMPCERALNELLKGHCDMVITELLEIVPEWPLSNILIETQRYCLAHKKGLSLSYEEIPRLILAPQSNALRGLEDSIRIKLGINTTLLCEAFDKALTAEMISTGYAYGFLPESFTENYDCCSARDSPSAEINFYAVYNPGIMDFREIYQYINF